MRAPYCAFCTSTPNASFTIDFYATPACDGSGFGEGNTYLGSTNVATDGTGSVAFLQALTVPAGDIVTATATDAAGNTSEFSQCASLAPARVLADHAAYVAPAATGFCAETQGVRHHSQRQLRCIDDGVVDGVGERHFRRRHQIPARGLFALTD